MVRRNASTLATFGGFRFGSTAASLRGVGVTMSAEPLRYAKKKRLRNPSPRTLFA